MVVVIQLGGGMVVGMNSVNFRRRVSMKVGEAVLLELVELVRLQQCVICVGGFLLIFAPSPLLACHA